MYTTIFELSFIPEKFHKELLILHKMQQNLIQQIIQYGIIEDCFSRSLTLTYYKKWITVELLLKNILKIIKFGK